MRRWFVIVAMLSVLVTGSTTQGTDYVVKRIVCPSSIPMKIDWVKHIGSDPTFTEVRWDGQYPEAKFLSMRQMGQKLYCNYNANIGTDFHPGEPDYGYYSYTAKRKILECQKVSAAMMDCKVEP